MEEKDKEKKFFCKKFKDGIFLGAIFELYLTKNKLWQNYWSEIVGQKYHYRDTEWKPEYDEFDGDFVEVFIKNNDGTFSTKCFLYSDFIDWQYQYIKKPNKICNYGCFKTR